MASWNGAVATREETRATKRRVALGVAARIFNEKGYHATSLEEIAEAIGVTKTALYYYFRSKEDLLYACLRLSYDCGRTAREEAEAMGGTGFERFCHLYGRFMELLMEERGAYTTTANLRALPQARQDELLDERRRLDRFSRKLLIAGLDSDSVEEEPPPAWRARASAWIRSAVASVSAALSAARSSATIERSCVRPSAPGCAGRLMISSLEA